MRERYYEWCPDVFRRKGTMLKSSVFPKIVNSKMCSGYRSVYSFSKEAAMEIRESRSSAGLDRFEVGADRIAIDLDDGEKQLKEVEVILQREGLHYDVENSGGKGFHIFIPTDFMCDVNLPYSHLQFLLDLGIDCDESLYQAGRILSMIGRVHPKTKIKKHHVKTVEGKMADVKIVEKPVFTFSGGDQESTGGLAEAMILTSSLAINEPRPGGRHIAIWSLSKDLIKCGLADTTIHDLMNNIVRKWDNPKTDEEIIKIIAQARRQC